MAKTVNISLDGVQRLLRQVQDYFLGLTLYQQLAWGAVGLGVLLLVSGAIAW